MGETTPVRAGRPRSEFCQKAILNAALDLLAEEGMAGFTIEAVSARSGVARTTIYRRWPTKGALAIDSFLHSVRAEIDASDTASAVADLRTSYLKMIRLMQGRHGRILVGILAEGQSDPAMISAFTDGYLIPARATRLQILDRGIKSGEFRADLDPHLVLELLFGAAYRRLLLHLPLDEGWGNAVFDLVLTGCAAQPQHASQGMAA
jgi:AcrR family transcriptional regulator